MPRVSSGTAALLAMEAAPAGSVLEVLADVLAEHLRATEVELLLVDYGLRLLRAVPRSGSAGPTAEMDVDGTVAGRVFTSGRLATGAVGPDGVTVHLPVTVRGDRRGVLRLRLPSPPDASERAELSDLGVLVGHALAAAERDTDVFDRAAGGRRLSLAAEMQWQMLPGRYCRGAEFTVAGQLEPAYAVGGDSFDWSCAANQLQVVVCDGTTEGTRAAMLTHLGVTALRNARRIGCDLPEQARLADQAVYAHHRGERFLPTLLLRFDFDAGRAWAIDAGSPLLFRQRGSAADGSGLERIELEQQLPLGMFDGTDYVAQEFPVERGDRLLVVTDGLHDAEPAPGIGRFGEVGLPAVSAASRGLPVDEAARRILRQLTDHQAEAGLGEDALVLCIDWLEPETQR